MDIWDEKFWFPGNRTYGWKDLVNVPNSGVYFPQINHLHWALPMGVALLLVRYMLERFVVIPVGVWMGISLKRASKPAPNPQLEAAYKTKKHLDHKTVQVLTKQTDLTERQVEVWFRRRKAQDAPTQMQKFTECCWHLIFYSTVFIYGGVILWEKPYLWSTKLCWDSWPTQHVPNDVYWYYMIELAFYWSLVFTLCSDHKRKDFKEMIVHHVATMVLMYFSWILNFVRVGTLVLLVHDAADSWLSLAKISIYRKNKTATDVFFGIFLIVWVISRLIIYPCCLLYCTTVEPYTVGLIDTTFGAHQFFNFFLYVLQVLHIIWTYLIFRIVYRKMVKGNVQDVRSDTEEDGNISDIEEDETEESPPASNVTDKCPNKGDVNENDEHLNGMIKSNGFKKHVEENGGGDRNGVANGNNNMNQSEKSRYSPSRIPRAKVDQK